MNPIPLTYCLFFFLFLYPSYVWWGGGIGHRVLYSSGCPKLTVWLRLAWRLFTCLSAEVEGAHNPTQNAACFYKGVGSIKASHLVAGKGKLNGVLLAFPYLQPMNEYQLETS